MKRHAILSLSLGFLILLSLLLVESSLNLKAKAVKPDLEQLVSRYPKEWEMLDGQQVKFWWSESALSEYDMVASRAYRHTDGRNVLLVMTWSGDGFNRKGHKQQVCYIASGYAVSPSKVVSISTGKGALDALAFTADQAGMKEDVVYWRVTDGIRERGIDDRATVVQRLQRLLYLPGLFRGELPDNLMVRVSSSRLTSDQPATAHIDFIREWVKTLSRADYELVMGR